MQEIDKLIEDNKGLVYAQLIKFKLTKDPEAESIAYEALYNAIVNYDSSKGNRLSTVATVYIYNALGCYLRKINGKRQLHTFSYNNVAYTDDNGEHEFIEVLSNGDSVEDAYIVKEEHRLVRDLYDELYDNLTNETQKAILGIWKKSEFIATTTEISKQLGVSQSYVSQVINNFKFSLKKKMEEAYYE